MYVPKSTHIYQKVHIRKEAINTQKYLHVLKSTDTYSKNLYIPKSTGKYLKSTHTYLKSTSTHRKVPVRTKQYIFHQMYPQKL